MKFSFVETEDYSRQTTVIVVLPHLIHMKDTLNSMKYTRLTACAEYPTLHILRVLTGSRLRSNMPL
jgi:hypothetical protein